MMIVAFLIVIFPNACGMTMLNLNHSEVQEKIYRNDMDPIIWTLEKAHKESIEPREPEFKFDPTERGRADIENRREPILIDIDRDSVTIKNLPADAIVTIDQNNMPDDSNPVSTEEPVTPKDCSSYRDPWDERDREPWKPSEPRNEHDSKLSASSCLAVRGTYKLEGMLTNFYEPIWTHLVPLPDITESIISCQKNLEEYNVEAIASTLEDCKQKLSKAWWWQVSDRYRYTQIHLCIEQAVKKNALMNQLLLIHQAKSIQDALFVVNKLTQLLKNNSIKIDNRIVPLDANKRIIIITQVKKIITNRSDYAQLNRADLNAIHKSIDSMHRVGDHIKIWLNSHAAFINNSVAKSAAENIQKNDIEFFMAALCQVNPDLAQYQAFIADRLLVIQHKSTTVATAIAPQDSFKEILTEYFQALVDHVNVIKNPQEFIMLGTKAVGYILVNDPKIRALVDVVAILQKQDLFQLQKQIVSLFDGSYQDKKKLLAESLAEISLDFVLEKVIEKISKHIYFLK